MKTIVRMKYTITLCLAAATIAGCAHTSYTAKPVVIRPEILAIQDYTQGVDSREEVTVVQDIVRASLGSEKESRLVAAELTKLLHEPGTTLDAKRALCRQLWLVAGPQNVHSIAKLLGHVETADMARYALEQIPDASVDSELLYYLDKGPDSAKPGMIDSLAVRGTVSAVETLQKLAESSNSAISDAAQAALLKLDS